jgi:hypothetical protein
VLVPSRDGTRLCIGQLGLQLRHIGRLFRGGLGRLVRHSGLRNPFFIQ